MKNSLTILLMFVIGLLLALYKFLPDFLINNDFTLYTLYALMFFVGIGIGSDTKAFKVIRETKIKIILVPLCVIVGSLLGAAIISFFIEDINMVEAMAVGAGFGYYSLSSIFITEISGETLGVIALLSNISREIITLLAAAFFVKYFGKLGAITAGGATSMDTCLPIISETTGKEWAIIAVFSGVILTIIVPFLVPFILTFV
ncbi:lysine exporter LysO family protein [Tenacibaculum aiptasiae]|uniref:Lysine exporter LysO family protein n=1 Tax=Tenacibaculum aiptasiae TaxID=426481 RepID=A0A7J5A8Y9_9FLAO|nr:lysine exporter LysO family protein [Tenacibaculum aiptasiae]KAB1153923.1 lysine exporter LysO family protein [Tenacibaculum aiptasiae]